MAATAATARFRDYRLTGPEGRGGPKIRHWHRCRIPRERLRELSQRRDAPGLVWFGGWIALLVASAFLAWASLGSWWSVPAFAAYGVLYCSAADSRWHECGHRTAFRTGWLDDVFFQVCSFLILREPHLWRWSHARHHAETLVVGRDPEIAYPRPPDITGMLLDLLHLKSGPRALARVVRHAFGRISEEERAFVPETEHPKLVRTARIWLAILTAVAAACFATGSIVPALFVGLPTFYGFWLHHILAVTQHAGLAEDVPDHRLNSRTVRLNPLVRFLYCNMNYHIEHHMFPSVPYHALPALHREIADQLPPVYPGLRAAYREILPALWRQRHDPAYHVVRPPPAGA